MGGEALALAYMGPGAGIAAVGALIGLVWVVVNVIVGLVWHPVRQLRRWWRERRFAGRGASSADNERTGTAS